MKRVLNKILQFLDDRDLNYEDDYPIKLAKIYTSSLLEEPSSVIQKTANVKSNFFVQNGIKKQPFLKDLLKYIQPLLDDNKHMTIEIFTENYLHPKLNSTDQAKIDSILLKIGSIRSPHEKLLRIFGRLLNQISSTHQIHIHGNKEFSGVDIVKAINSSIVGFQIKGPNDEIDEKDIRYQHSQALGSGLDGYILIFARKETRKVVNAQAAAFNTFSSFKDKSIMYCDIIAPSNFAKLLMDYNIQI